MIDITPEMARAELAKRELERRGSPYQTQDSTPQYEQGSEGLGGKLGEYLQGYGPGLLQAGAEGGRDVARAISYPGRALYGKVTGQPTYELPEVDVMGLAPKTQSGQTGAKVGQGMGELAMALLPIAKTAKAGADVARVAGPKIASKAGDIAPILKSIASKPYKNQMKALEGKGLMGGYQPNLQDISEASKLLKSPGMEIPHAAVDEAVWKAIQGDFKPWFNIQSSVRSEGRRLSKKGGVHNTLGKKLHGLAEKMHSDMGQAQISRGAPEAADFMNQGKERMARHYKISPYPKIAAGAVTAAALPKWVSQMFKTAIK
tara:strand:+ start:3040 stop:3990 length:951 start_codon:yes stop_codon:yes gene_type:complete